MTNDNTPISSKITNTPLPKMELHPEFGDPECLWNMRKWLQNALEKQGAIQTGAGMGMGAADIDFTLEGYSYNVVIKPRV